MKIVTAIAHPNIALIKYWGKRDVLLNLPAVGSISMTLADLFTRTSLIFAEDLAADVLHLNGQPARPEQTQKVSRFLDLIRQPVGLTWKAEVRSENNFPTGAGLASSASAFAALALAGATAAGLSLSPTQLSALARRGSGSASRSIFGGFVEWEKGILADGSDSVARQLVDESSWDLRWLVVITTEMEKDVGSTDGMRLSEQTSPYYAEWLRSQEKDLLEMRAAIFTKDFAHLGELMEHNCLKMHALTISSRPPLIYWNDVTLRVMKQVQVLRREGIPVYFTIDAGPQVKALCPPNFVTVVQLRLSEIDGVVRIVASRPGSAARIVDEKNVVG